MSSEGNFALWVFALESAQDPQVIGEIRDSLAKKLEDWNSHGNPLKAEIATRDSIFLVIAEAGISLAKISDVFFRNEQGVISCSRSTFVERVASGEIDSNTLVYDTTVDSKAQYESGFLKEAGDSWHWQLVGNMR